MKEKCQQVIGLEVREKKGLIDQRMLFGNIFGRGVKSWIFLHGKHMINNYECVVIKLYKYRDE